MPRQEPDWHYATSGTWLTLCHVRNLTDICHIRDLNDIMSRQEPDWYCATSGTWLTLCHVRNLTDIMPRQEPDWHYATSGTWLTTENIFKSPQFWGVYYDCADLPQPNITATYKSNNPLSSLTNTNTNTTILKLRITQSLCVHNDRHIFCPMCSYYYHIPAAFTPSSNEVSWPLLTAEKGYSVYSLYCWLEG